MKYPTRQLEMEREAELVELYVAEGFSIMCAERQAEADVQFENHGYEQETAESRWNLEDMN